MTPKKIPERKDIPDDHNWDLTSLFGDNIPETVYENLIKTVKSNLAPFFKYMDFRKQTLALSELHFYDTYVPIVSDVTFDIPYEAAVEISIQAMRPLGEKYIKVLQEGLLGGWVDRYENRGKRSGAYSSGCYDSSPYILLFMSINMQLEFRRPLPLLIKSLMTANRPGMRI